MCSDALEGLSRHIGSGVDGFIVDVDEVGVDECVCEGIGSIVGVELRLIDVWIASVGCGSLYDVVEVGLAVVVSSDRDWTACG